MGFKNFDPDEGGKSWSRTIRDMMDEMLQRNFVGFRRTATWAPAINVYESKDAFIVCVDLAGMQADEIEVHCLTTTRVSIAGRRGHPQRSTTRETVSIHLLEIEEGPFQREIDLPQAVDADAVVAKYEDGFLWITLPRAGQAR